MRGNRLGQAAKAMVVMAKLGKKDRRYLLCAVPGDCRFEAFGAALLSTYAKNNNKPSEVRSKEAILRVHLVPAFGKLRLDAIGPKEVETYRPESSRRDCHRNR